MRHENVREEQSDDDSYLVLASLYNVNYWRKKNQTILAVSFQIIHKLNYQKKMIIFLKNAKRHIAIINYF